MALAEKAFACSSQILIDQDLRGWKEIEYEVRTTSLVMNWRSQTPARAVSYVWVRVMGRQTGFGLCPRMEFF